jgi:peptidoglycan/LPS O-acetylase OafA/YrhL
MTEYHRTDSVAYRADIDGLRAVAIVPVVLYHADLGPFGGGFVGVDVFFVISGYLITSFILGQIDSGRFSLDNFYLRRIRRIFPALFLMMAGCAAIGWLLLTPQDYRRLGESIFAAVFFSSNILFWLQSGYFATPLEERPLLHTWSLGVEEQFYVAFPIFLVLLCRFFPRRLIGITLAFCLLSFGFNVLTFKAHPGLAFFLTPSRIWELFVGALLAMGALAPPRSDKWSEAAGLLGAALIGYAIFGFSKDTAFPGFAALLPAAGAAGIIWSGMGGKETKGGLTRSLSHPALVLTGKISYSLYLWHFPLLAFAAYVIVGGPSLTARLALVVLAVVLAFASWFYVEQPVRQGRWIFGNTKAVFGTAAAALALFGGFGLAAHFAGGFPGRIGEPGLQILASEGDINPDRGSCLKLDDATDITRRPLCNFGVTNAAPQFALWGDSHAESLRASVDVAARKVQRAGIFFGTAGCIPELGIDRDSGGCDRVNEAIAAYLLSQPSIHTFVLAGRWGLWAEGSPYKHEAGKRVSLADASGVPLDNHAALTAGLERVVAKLTGAGKQVWLVGPIPEIGYNVPRTLYFDSLGVPRSIHIQPTRKEFDERESFVLALFARIAEKYNVRAVWPHQYLCDARLCQVQKEGRPLYVDDQHLTRSAAKSMSAIFDPIFADSVRSDRPIAETR